MIFDAHDNYTRQLQPFINTLHNNILSNTEQKKETYTYKNALLKAIMEGSIRYENNYFKGRYTRDVIRELENIHAIKKQYGYYLERPKVPLYVLHVIDRKRKIDTSAKNNIVNKLSKLDVNDLIDETKLLTITTSIFNRITKNSVKEGFGDVSSLKLTKIYKLLFDSLKGNIKMSLENLASSLLSRKEPIQASQLKSLLSSSIAYKIDSTVKATVNQQLFEIQKKICEDNKVSYFWWWHRPTERPSDRQYHRKHYEDSRKGKKFYWNNLPVWNGEPDYPGKLWNCHCRAFIDFKEFKQAHE